MPCSFAFNAFCIGNGNLQVLQKIVWAPGIIFTWALYLLTVGNVPDSACIGTGLIRCCVHGVRTPCSIAQLTVVAWNKFDRFFVRSQIAVLLSRVSDIFVYSVRAPARVEFLSFFQIIDDIIVVSSPVSTCIFIPVSSIMAFSLATTMFLRLDAKNNPSLMKFSEHDGLLFNKSLVPLLLLLNFLRHFMVNCLILPH